MPRRQAPEVPVAREHSWLHQPVFARHRAEWVHGQVIRLELRSAVVRTPRGNTVSCRIAALHATDPILALLFGCSRVDPSLRLDEVEKQHAAVLDRLLGSSSAPRTRPSRDISRLLQGVVDDADIPDGDSTCLWTAVSQPGPYQFPLQHAVDFVFVNESTAARIPRSVRAGVGAAFYLPPASAAPQAPDSFFGSDDDVPPVVTSGDSGDSPLVAAASTSRSDGPRPAAAAERLPNEPTDDHLRVLKELAAYPAVLEAYLRARDAAAPQLAAASPQLAAKRPRVPSDLDRVRPRKQRLNQFEPPSAHQRVHDLITQPSHAGKSAHEFVDDLIHDPAIAFAPHPGILMRLFDFQFGIRGLSIMHLFRLCPIARMTWVMESKVNMHDFSASANPPTPYAPRRIDDITDALSSLRVYCATFCTLDVAELVEKLLVFTQQMIGMNHWEAADLKYFVYWIDGILEQFRACAHQDAISGGTSRTRVKDTVSASNPQLASITQLITTKKVDFLLQASRHRPPPHVITPAPPPSSAPPSSRNLRYGPPTQQRRREDRPSSSDIANLVPRQGDRTLCLKSISCGGCPGRPGAPDQCQYYNSRAHFVPAVKLDPAVREYVERHLGGIRQDLRHL